MVEVAYAPPQEREEIAQFMCAAFPKAKWDIDGWRRLLDGRWGRGAPYAVTVRDGGVLVGVLGLVSATRLTDAGPRQTMNMTSWYVLKSHRGMGLGSKMLGLITADPAITITNYSSAKGAVPVVERAGLKVLDTQRLVWRARGQTTTINVVTDPVKMAKTLTQKDHQILQDHAGLNVQFSLVETEDGPCLIAVMVKQKHDDYVTYETMYLGQPNIFARHARAIADSLLPAGNAVLSVDSRFVPDGTAADAVVPFDVPRFYTSGAMTPADVDHLYSEIVLLDMKMY
jgi:hypothetical protein